MKKTVTFVLILFSLFSLYAIRNVGSSVKDYDSYPMLEKYYHESDLSSADEKYWEETEVSLLTVSKGNPVYSWFGHSLILFEFSDDFCVTFDWGRFSFNEGFYRNFAMGRLWYECGEAYAPYELESFEEEGRSVSKVVLNLSPIQKEAIYNFVYKNSQEDLRTYMYHHYNDNCATRIRDIIDYATDGQFSQWAKAQSGYSFREQTARILYANIFWQWLLDFLQSGNIDGDATLWDEMFLPEKLEEAVLLFDNLALSQEYAVDLRSTDTRHHNSPEPVPYLWKMIIFGLVISLLSAWLFKYRKVWSSLTFVICLVFGLVGSLLFFMMNFTSHDVTWNNENILIINPILLAIAILSFNREKHRRILFYGYCLMTLLSVVLILLKIVLPHIFIQANWPQICTVVFFYLSNTLMLFKREFLSKKAASHCEEGLLTEDCNPLQ